MPATKTPLSLMRRIAKRPGIAKVTISLVGGRLYAHAYPTLELARDAVRLRFETEGRSSVDLNELTEAVAWEQNHPLTYGRATTIEEALENLEAALKKLAPIRTAER